MKNFHSKIIYIQSLEDNLIYTTLTDKDRLRRDSWFSNCDNAYTQNAKDEYIQKDINFIKSLIPQ